MTQNAGGFLNWLRGKPASPARTATASPARTATAAPASASAASASATAASASATAAPAVESAEEMELKKLKLELPDTEQTRYLCLSLKFFALCPNGKRIPVESLCEEYARDPDGLVLRTFDDRLVLVIQAMIPGEETPYWQQAFYLSTGTSSKMGDTWLPFDGIVAKYWGNMKEKYVAEHNNKLAITSWFAKDNFLAITDSSQLWYPIRRSLTLNEKKRMIIEKTYSKQYLPEGNPLLIRQSNFDRFGTLSYLLASQALGGNSFKRPVTKYYDSGRSTIREFYDTEEKRNSMNARADALIQRLDIPSPLQPCFTEMSKTYPISKPVDVNNYIDKHKACSYMNAFRPYNLFAPGLQYANVPIPSLGYSLPSLEIVNLIQWNVKRLWLSFTKGEISLQEVRTKLEHPEKYVDEYTREEHLKGEYVPTNTNVEMVVHQSQQGPQTIKYYGGKRTRKQKRRSKKRKTRKV
jgi:hypothetical protein